MNRAATKQDILDHLEASPIGCMTRKDLMAAIRGDVEAALYSLESEMAIVTEGDLIMLADG